MRFFASFSLFCLLLSILPASSFFFLEPSPWGTANGNIEKTKVSSYYGFSPANADNLESNIVTVPLPFAVKKIRADRDIVFATGPLKKTSDGQKKFQIAALRYDGTIAWSYDGPSEFFIAVNFKLELILAYNVNDTHTNVEKRKAQTGDIIWTVTLARIDIRGTLPEKYEPYMNINTPLAIEVVGPKLLLLSDKFLYWGLDETTGDYLWKRNTLAFDLIEDPTPVTALSLNGFQQNDLLQSFYWSSKRTNVLSHSAFSSLYSASIGVAKTWDYRFEPSPIKNTDVDPRPQVMYLEDPQTVVFKFNAKIFLLDANTGSLKSIVNRESQKFLLVAGSSLWKNSTAGTQYAFYIMTKDQLERIYFQGSQQIPDWKVPIRGDQQPDIAIGRLIVDKKTNTKKELIHVCDGFLTVYDSNKNVLFPSLAGCNSEIIVASDNNIAYINGTYQVSFLNYNTPPKYTSEHLTVIVVVAVVVVLLLGGGLLGYLYFKRRGGFPVSAGGFLGKRGQDEDHRPLTDDDDDFDINRNKPEGDFFRQGSL